MTDVEKDTLECRIDELCQEVEAEKQHNAKLLEAAEKWMVKAAHFEAENAKLHDEVERLHADQAHWELGNCSSCPNVVSLQEALEQNTKLRELAISYDSALHRMCNQMQGHIDCHDCILGKDYGDDSCAIDELREAACVMKVDLDD